MQTPKEANLAQDSTTFRGQAAVCVLYLYCLCLVCLFAISSFTLQHSIASKSRSFAIPALASDPCVTYMIYV